MSASQNTATAIAATGDHSPTLTLYEEGVREGLALAEVICLRNAAQFLSSDYATGQPQSSFAERFACREIARDIKAAIERVGLKPCRACGSTATRAELDAAGTVNCCPERSMNDLIDAPQPTPSEAAQTAAEGTV